MPQKSVTPQKDVLSTLYNTKIKVFPHQIKVTCFNRAIFNPDGVETNRHNKPKNEKQEQEELLTEAAWLEYLQQTDYEQYLKSKDQLERHQNLTTEKKRIRRDSMKRAKDKAMEIAFANDWQFFITFTLDNKNINRYDKTEVLRCFTQWLKNMTRRRNLKYLIFPEFHKDGAIHFHGLCSGDILLAMSGHFTKAEQPIYNCLNWTLGYTSVVRLEGPKERIVNYIMKYITKENEKVFGNAYFAGGKGLVREVPTQYENISFEELEGKEYQVPDTGMRVKYQTIPR